jgi:hypothetical protein
MSAFIDHIFSPWPRWYRPIGIFPIRFNPNAAFNWPGIIIFWLIEFGLSIQGFYFVIRYGINRPFSKRTNSWLYPKRLSKILYYSDTDIHALTNNLSVENLLSFPERRKSLMRGCILDIYSMKASQNISVLRVTMVEKVPGSWPSKRKIAELYLTPRETVLLEKRFGPYKRGIGAFNAWLSCFDA